MHFAKQRDKAGAGRDGAFCRARRRASGLAVLAVGLCAGWVAAGPGTRFLRLRFAPIQSKPSFAEGKRTSTAYLGQAFEVLAQEGGWVKVRLQARGGQPEAEPKAREGWIHESALSGKAKDAPGGARQDAAARPWLKDGAEGLKGLAPRKAGWAKAHAQARKLDLDAVRAIEKNYPSAGTLRHFLQAGDLGLYRTDWPAREESGEGAKP